MKHQYKIGNTKYKDNFSLKPAIYLLPVYQHD